MRKMKKFISVIGVMLLAFAAAIVMYGCSKASKIDKTDLDDENLNKSDEMEDNETYLNVALFGIDAHSEDQKDVESDFIVIASINKETKEVKLLNVYGNTMLASKDGKMVAAKSIYKNGAEDAIEVLNRNLDLDIDRYVTIDFKAIIDVIDTLGGIELDITEEEIPHVNGYTADLNTVAGKNAAALAQPGKQTLNGTQAVGYCRIRATEGADETRSERQKAVINQMLDKMLSSNLVTIDEIIDETFPKIETNFELTEVLAYGKDLAKYKLNEMKGFPYTVSDKTVEGNADAIVPGDFKNDVVKVHQDFFPDFSYEASENVKEASEVFK